MLRVIGLGVLYIMQVRRKDGLKIKRFPRRK